MNAVLVIKARNPDSEIENELILSNYKYDRYHKGRAIRYIFFLLPKAKK